eukprot:14927329-Alexandrium_andersonii.AAC.1
MAARPRPRLARARPRAASASRPSRRRALLPGLRQHSDARTACPWSTRTRSSTTTSARRRGRR